MLINFKSLLPTAYVASIYDYDLSAAYARGKRLILFDIDNTLVPHGAPADDAAKAWFISGKEQGFSFCEISNNREPRVKNCCDAVGVPYVYKARKPSAKGYEHALGKCGASASQALFFGDQIFTDIWGANRAGIDSVLVRPVDLSTDEIQIRLKRIFEKPAIKAFFREKGLAIYDHFH